MSDSSTSGVQVQAFTLRAFNGSLRQLAIKHIMPTSRFQAHERALYILAEDPGPLFITSHLNERSREGGQHHTRCPYGREQEQELTRTAPSNGVNLRLHIDL